MTTQTPALQITPAQLKCLNTLVSKRGINKEDKAAMVAGFSNGRETSSKQLFYHEAELMIKHLHALQPNAAQAATMRNKIIYYAHEMNWRINGKADIKRIDEWCNKFGYLHKDLDHYDYSELPKLISQIEIVYQHYLHKL